MLFVISNFLGIQPASSIVKELDKSFANREGFVQFFYYRRGGLNA